MAFVGIYLSDFSLEGRRVNLCGFGVDTTAAAFFVPLNTPATAFFEIAPAATIAASFVAIALDASV